MEDTRGEHMKVLKKTIKTYGKEGKRKYQQIKINKSDNIEDGTVYVLTEDKYNELAQYEESHKQVTGLKKDNIKLHQELEELQAKLSSLVEDNHKYKSLNGIQIQELAKLESINNTLSQKIETATIETVKVTAQLEATKGQLEDLAMTVTQKDSTINELQKELYEHEKVKLTQLYSIHNRLMTLSRWDMILGKHKPIIKEIAPTNELEVIETTTNK